MTTVPELSRQDVQVVVLSIDGSADWPVEQVQRIINLHSTQLAHDLRRRDELSSELRQVERRVAMRTLAIEYLSPLLP